MVAGLVARETRRLGPDFGPVILIGRAFFPDGVHEILVFMLCEIRLAHV
jgi:hypothetical protein